MIQKIVLLFMSCIITQIYKDIFVPNENIYFLILRFRFEFRKGISWIFLLFSTTEKRITKLQEKILTDISFKKFFRDCLIDTHFIHSYGEKVMGIIVEIGSL